MPIFSVICINFRNYNKLFHWFDDNKKDIECNEFSDHVINIESGHTVLIIYLYVTNPVPTSYERYAKDLVCVISSSRKRYSYCLLAILHDGQFTHTYSYN